MRQSEAAAERVSAWGNFSQSDYGESLGFVLDLSESVNETLSDGCFVSQRFCETACRNHCQAQIIQGFR